MTQNKTKRYMKIALISATILSLAIAWIMAQNLIKDESKERFALTTAYKKFKKEKYTYKPAAAKKLYLSLCSSCHKQDGTGTLQNPPLSKTYTTSAKLLVKIMVRGLEGKLIINEQQYNSTMPSFKALGHTDLAHIANYIRRELHHIKDDDIHPIEVIKAKVDALVHKSSLNTKEIEAVKK